MDLGLKGKAALITGGSDGIGAGELRERCGHHGRWQQIRRHLMQDRGEGKHS